MLSQSIWVDFIRAKIVFFFDTFCLETKSIQKIQEPRDAATARREIFYPSVTEKFRSRQRRPASWLGPSHEVSGPLREVDPHPSLREFLYSKIEAIPSKEFYYICTSINKVQ